MHSRGGAIFVPSHVRNGSALKLCAREPQHGGTEQLREPHDSDQRRGGVRVEETRGSRVPGASVGLERRQKRRALCFSRPCLFGSSALPLLSLLRASCCGSCFSAHRCYNGAGQKACWTSCFQTRSKVGTERVFPIL